MRTLTDYERKRLNGAVWSPNDPFISLYASVILYSSLGLPPSAVTKLTKVNKETVEQIIQTFNEEGLQVLEPRNGVA